MVLVQYLIFELVKKKIAANLQRIIELFTQKSNSWLKKLSLSSLKYGFESGIRKKPIPDPGVKKAPYPASRILIRNSDR